MNYAFKGDLIRVASTISKYGPDSPTMNTLHWETRNVVVAQYVRQQFQSGTGSLGDSWRVFKSLVPWAPNKLCSSVSEEIQLQ